MAITNNTDFVSGAILTAQQQNNFPRGIMAIRKRDTNTAALAAGTETVTIAAVNFTAVANRNYRITYYEPQMVFGAGHTHTNMLVRNGTTTAGTLLQVYGATGTTTTTRGAGHLSLVTTFSAGSTNIVATADVVGGTNTLNANSTFPAFLMVEDIGTA
jgi:hypothetical protein